MADTAELKIKPVLAGSSRALFSPLSSGLRGLGSVAGGVGRTISGTISKLTSIKSMLVGFAVYGGGKTLLENTIGSADAMAMAEARMKGILGSTERVGVAMDNVGRIIKEIPSLGRSDAVQGMENFLSVTKGSVDEASELVKLAKALEATSPDQSFEDAQFAIKELIGSGDVMSLRSRFGLKLPTSEEAKKLAKQDGKVLSTFYLDTLLEELGGKYGQSGGTVVDFLLGIDRDSVGGKISQIKSVVADTMTTIGAHARRPVLDNLSVVADKWTAMVETPEFKSSIVSLSEFFASAAGAITGKLPALIDKLPGAMRSVIDAFKAVGAFYERHPTLVKVLGGAAAANWLTGGALGRIGGSLIAAGVGKGAQAIGAGGLGGCCCDGGGAASKAGKAAEQGFFGKLLGKGKNLMKFGSLAAPGAAAGLSAAELGAVTTSATAAAGAAAAAAIPFALGGLGIHQFNKALGAPKDIGNAAFDKLAIDNWSKRFEDQIAAGDLSGIKRDITGMLGRAGGDTLSTERQQAFLNVFDRALNKSGLKVDLKDGAKLSELKFDNTWFSGMEKTAEKLNKTEITVNVAVPPGSQVDGEQVKEMARRGADEALTQKARQARAMR